jgi:tRNA-splicing ligase RtcB
MSDNYIVIPPEGSMRCPVKAWVTGGVPIEDQAIAQLRNVASLPFIFRHVAAMPDVHWGMGATVGSVIPCVGAIPPAAVGVDIGCGMMATRTTLRRGDVPSDLQPLFAALSRAVPSGRTDNGGPGDRGAWHDIPQSVSSAWEGLEAQYLGLIDSYPELVGRNSRAHLTQLGTLGTGNHFLELSLDEHERVWLVIHSGSRGIGNKIGSVFTEIAKGLMGQFFVNLPDPALAYLPDDTEQFDGYMDGVEWAQTYAKENRRLMTERALLAVEAECGKADIEEQFDCHHNYVARENHYGKNVLLVRKGAIRAREGDVGIIPGSMGARSFIVRGKGNPESFMSCSHGAGRAMSRTAARQKFTVEDHCRTTAGVTCLKDASVLDETPQAYKDIDLVMAAQSDLVEVVDILKQFLCLKGAETDGKPRRKKQQEAPSENRGTKGVL